MRLAKGRVDEWPVKGATGATGLGPVASYLGNWEPADTDTEGRRVLTKLVSVRL